LAYNRVGLTEFFLHRSVKDLYLNPEEWYAAQEEGRLYVDVPLLSSSQCL
jgi:nitrite reductase (NAD(P)H)